MNARDKLFRAIMGGPKPPHRPFWIWKRWWLCESCPRNPKIEHTKAAAILHALDTGHRPTGTVWRCNPILHPISDMTYQFWWERLPLLNHILIITTCKEPM